MKRRRFPQPVARGVVMRVIGAHAAPDSKPLIFVTQFVGECVQDGTLPLTCGSGHE